MAGEPQGLASPRGPEGHGLVWLLLLSLSLFIVLLPISSYIAALSFIKSELGLNNAGAGALFSAYLAGYAASALYLVPLTDRLGPKRIIYVSAALSVAAHLLFPLMTYNVVAGAALRAIAGVGFLGIYIPGLRLVARRFEQSGRGSAMGLFVTAQYAAHSGSLALTGWLNGHDGVARRLRPGRGSIGSKPAANVLPRALRSRYAPTAHGWKARPDRSQERPCSIPYPGLHRARAEPLRPSSLAADLPRVLS